MPYDPDDYAVDGRSVGAGFGLAAVALLGLIFIDCPATSAASPLKEEAFSRHGTVAPAGCIQGLTSIERHLATRALLTA
jgi:hypothetical protein